MGKYDTTQFRTLTLIFPQELVSRRGVPLSFKTKCSASAETHKFLWIRSFVFQQRCRNSWKHKDFLSSKPPPERLQPNGSFR